ncbi:probable galactinol--sucrose galactosyltransferase 2 [Salvia miltiorrhiza]|uniref:probable galactinol--sucrose galactosyltransferase 2 n=1 Tax=Salvia miltiorrhiza TaxID=226208 RepID=UPI0025AD41E9|nr:probable galactinol--sucrose galactosyltransferase 2 [Salvia miltiorrhiza]
MTISTTFNATAAIYRSMTSRNFFKRLPLNHSYYHRTTAHSALNITFNSCKESTFSSYHSRISDRRESYTSGGNSFRGKNFTGVALKAEAAMTVAAALCIEDGSLLVNGRVVLEGVPENVAVYPVTDGLSFSSTSAAFIGASSSIPSSRHVFSLGVLRECRFMGLFRHKIWWMIPRFGSSGSDIRMETQMLLLEVREESAVQDDSFLGQSADNTSYVLFLPVLEGRFRATLQGNSANELELCVESGDAHVQTTQVSEAVFITSGSNPFELIRDSLRILENHKGTFTHIEHKKKPTHLDWFGWCTWDAFYRDVTPRGIREGLESFLEGGCPPKFLIIDDGWQDTFDEFQKEGEPCIEGTQFAIRLNGLKESSSFMETGTDISCHDLHDFVKFIKEKYGLKYVYVWHALVGYWGGLLRSSEKMKKYGPELVYPKQSPGNVGNTRDVAMDYLEKYGVGLIDPEKVYDFYNDLHSYLSSSGVDGVKVDIQNLIETLGAGYGGRVSLTRKYQTALEDSVARNFQENNLICCMSLNTDSIYSSKRSATVRASEDFMPRQPTFQTLHVASVAFNSLLLGEIMVPDWDMFQSHHYTAEFHGAARAVGGCPVYVSDKPGIHDFKLLKKLVLPDGSILRGKYAGRPTRDCLFVDTVMDGKSLLKIWNMNKSSGVIGIFNCQGAGNWSLRDTEQQDPTSSSKSISLSGTVSPHDLESLGEIADERWKGDCAVYAFHTGSLSRLAREGSHKVTLATLECEVFTISPIHAVSKTLDFAPIGLIDMFNSGGATEGLSFSHDDPSGCFIRIEARGCGRFGAYSSEKPIHCTVDGVKVEFEYNLDSGLLIVKLEGECKIKNITICY